MVNWQRQLVEVYRRENRKWTYQRYEPEDNMEFASLQLEIPMNVIYANTTIPIRETREQD